MGKFNKFKKFNKFNKFNKKKKRKRKKKFIIEIRTSRGWQRVELLENTGNGREKEEKSKLCLKNQEQDKQENLI
jgi:hypothetical protein